MYARQRNPMLLQVTTNPCEAWNRKLRAGADLLEGQVSSHVIFGVILIMDAVNDDNWVAIVKSNFWNRKLAIA